MLDLKLFRNRNFAMGNAATAAIYAGLSAFTFLLSVFLQQVAGYLRHRRRARRRCPSPC